jgi:medium-chain acyl-[acyl-carrier-protein] hydrolase
MFLFPFAGGGASAFAPLVQYLEENRAAFVPVTVQIPGHESRFQEKPFTDLVKLSESTVDGLAPLLTERYYIYGHSMGSILAWEFARACQRKGLAGPEALFLGAREPQHTIGSLEPLHQLPDREFITTIAERYQTVPIQVLENDELLELIVPMMKADFQMLESYTSASGALIKPDIHCIGASDDSLVDAANLPQWDRWTEGKVTTTVVKGGHFFLTTNTSALGDFLIRQTRQRNPEAGQKKIIESYG